MIAIPTGKPEVGELDVPIQRYQDVFGLEVTVYDIVVVQELESFDDLWDQLANGGFIKAFVCEIVVKVPTLDILHDDVDFMRVLEGMNNLYEEGVWSVAEHLLDEVRLKQILFSDLGLIDDLHSKEAIALDVLSLHQYY